MDQFYDYIISNNLQKVKNLLQDGQDPNMVDDLYKMTPLFLAVYYGHLEMTQLLIESGSKVNILSSYNTTPLYYAITRGHNNIIKLLLEKEADINIGYARRQSFLYLAVEEKQFNSAKILLENGAEINYEILERAIYNNNFEMFDLLFNHNINLRTLHSSDLLECYLRVTDYNRTRLDIVKLLLQNNADYEYYKNYDIVKKTLAHIDKEIFETKLEDLSHLVKQIDKDDNDNNNTVKTILDNITKIRENFNLISQKYMLKLNNQID